ncbi:transcriptional regulator [Taylorella asinigenitalis]|uniref:Putative phage protein n=1 Tax=Taylorella asinigenitalis (strain MCE3) TaxID=1008459 RepID=G4QCW4_TAYAM|nr:YdaS family helix-turn-helix protein [Taylorella asinigenitalis]AEP36244.1 putative phage protein [Taylorella asinigenitalis MCE3]
MKLNEFINKSGLSANQLANLISVCGTQLWNWRHDKLKVPVWYCFKLEAVSDGLVTCEELRPDLNWDYIRSNKDNYKKNEPSI